MSRTRFQALLPVNLAFTLVSHAWAGDSMAIPPAGNWNEIQSLPQGTSLAAEMKYGAVNRGDFIRPNEDFIFLRVEAKEASYPKTNIS
jgi:hypothetical protein